MEDNSIYKKGNWIGHDNPDLSFYIFKFVKFKGLSPNGFPSIEYSERLEESKYSKNINTWSGNNNPKYIRLATEEELRRLPKDHPDNPINQKDIKDIIAEYL